MTSVAALRWGVRPIFPFEAGGRRFAFVVESAAFAELDAAGFALADFLRSAHRAAKSNGLTVFMSRERQVVGRQDNHVCHGE